jgi:2-polyprenyl-6-methoxyphenol hydroxylase-like FAD-dependent oxidoreductase
LTARLVIGATGQTDATPDRRRPARENGGTQEWIAISVRVRGGGVGTTVRLFALPGGYAGLCPIEGERANLCALLRLARPSAQPVDLVEMTVSNRLLRNYLENLQVDWDEAVMKAGMHFGTRPSAPRWDVGVGDAAAAPVPLLGQGLAAALIGGIRLAPFAERYLRGEIGLADLRRSYAAAWRRAPFCNGCC